MKKKGVTISAPNPTKYRKNTKIINDGWEFSIDGCGWQPINVPYCPQSKLSGIEHKGMIPRCFYRRMLSINPSMLDNQRVVVHFGAVDYRAILEINGRYVGTHTGGYTSFEFDISDYLTDGDNQLFLTVYDENKNVAFGKQTYKDVSFGCFYTHVTGIWQSVWLEYIPTNYVKDFYFYPDVDKCAVDMELLTSAEGDYEITVLFDGVIVGCQSGVVEFRKKITIPLSEKHLWDIGQGNLYDVVIRFGNDEVHSYFGLRSVAYQGYKFLLNGREVFQKLVLDQGYYPDGIYTATSDEDFIADIERGVRLGFNGARLHQKVVDPRFLYYCDKAGYMVWGEFPSWGIDYCHMDAAGDFLAQWQEVLKRDFNHPAIIHWCPLNEVWGDWEFPKFSPDMRFIELVYRYTKQFDPTRPCIDVSGGFHCAVTDLYDFHAYEDADQVRKYLDNHDRNGILDVPLLLRKGVSCDYQDGQPINASEYGGIAFGFAKAQDNSVKAVNERGVESETPWGYGQGESSADAFIERYSLITSTLLSYEKLSGYCYTQLYDVEQEVNGFYRYDRSDKLTEEQKDAIRDVQSRR